MRPISCPIQKFPSSLEGIFPLQNNVQVAILKSFLDSDENSEIDIVRNYLMLNNFMHNVYNSISILPSYLLADKLFKASNYGKKSKHGKGDKLQGNSFMLRSTHQQKINHSIYIQGKRPEAKFP